MDSIVEVEGVTITESLMPGPKISKASSWQVGDELLALDKTDNWYHAKVIRIDMAHQRALFHYKGWSANHDSWIPFGSKRVASYLPTADDDPPKEKKKSKATSKPAVSVAVKNKKPEPPKLKPSTTEPTPTPAPSRKRERAVTSSLKSTEDPRAKKAKRETLEEYSAEDDLTIPTIRIKLSAGVPDKKVPVNKNVKTTSTTPAASRGSSRRRGSAAIISKDTGAKKATLKTSTRIRTGTPKQAKSSPNSTSTTANTDLLPRQSRIVKSPRVVEAETRAGHGVVVGTKKSQPTAISGKRSSAGTPPSEAIKTLPTPERKTPFALRPVKESSIQMRAKILQTAKRVEKTSAATLSVSKTVMGSTNLPHSPSVTSDQEKKIFEFLSKDARAKGIRDFPGTNTATPDKGTKNPLKMSKTEDCENPSIIGVKLLKTYRRKGSLEATVVQMDTLNSTVVIKYSDGDTEEISESLARNLAIKYQQLQKTLLAKTAKSSRKKPSAAKTGTGGGTHTNAGKNDASGGNPGMLTPDVKAGASKARTTAHMSLEKAVEGSLVGLATTDVLSLEEEVARRKMAEGQVLQLNRRLARLETKFKTATELLQLLSTTMTANIST